MMENVVYLLRQGDNHLSKDSLVDIGIFSSEDELENGVRQALKENMKHNFWDWEWNDDFQSEKDAQSDYIESETKRMMEDFQTYLGDVLLIATEVTLNVLDEIN